MPATSFLHLRARPGGVTTSSIASCLLMRQRAGDESVANSFKGTLMKRVLFLTPLAAAAVAGCAPAPNQIQAGQWEIVSETRSFDVPGATPDQQRQMRAQMGRTDTIPQCFTAEQARTIVQDFRRGPPNCRVSDEQYANGVMRT